MNINSWIAWLAGGFTLLLLSALAILLVINANQRAELASDEAAYITGQVLAVDGGLVMM